MNTVRNRYSLQKYNELIPVTRKLTYINNTFYQKQFAKEIRLTGISEVLFARLQESYSNLMAVNRRYDWRGFLISCWDVVNQMGIVTYGGYLYLLYQITVLKNLTIGDFTAMFNAVRVVDVELRLTASQLTRIHSHSLYIDNYRTFIGYSNRIVDGSSSRDVSQNRNDIVVRGLSFGYDLSTLILKNIDMEIRTGEKVAIIGHNGAGKTTLVKQLLRLYDPQTGYITHNGKDIKEYRASDYRSMFGTVFQDFSLFAFTLGENILMRSCNQEDEGVVKNALRSSGFHIDMAIDILLTKEFDDKGYVPSGGLVQKIAIARAYAKAEHYQKVQQIDA